MERRPNESYTNRCQGLLLPMNDLALMLSFIHTGAFEALTF